MISHTNNIGFSFLSHKGSPRLQLLTIDNEVIDKLSNVTDYFLQHNLKITHPQDDSVVKFSDKFNQEVLFRRSRGFAPNYLNIDINSTEKIMAFGAVAEGNIKAREAEIVAGSIKSKGLTSMLMAKPANTGKKVSTVATFEVNSVRNVMSKDTDRIIMNGCTSLSQIN